MPLSEEASRYSLTFSINLYKLTSQHPAEFSSFRTVDVHSAAAGNSLKSGGTDVSIRTAEALELVHAIMSHVAVLLMFLS
jgi:hypothetical protein